MRMVSIAEKKLNYIEKTLFLAFLRIWCKKIENLLRELTRMDNFEKKKTKFQLKNLVSRFDEQKYELIWKLCK